MFVVQQFNLIISNVKSHLNCVSMSVNELCVMYVRKRDILSLDVNVGGKL